jgi:hypothetical protein
MGRVRQGSRAPAMVVTALATCGALAGAAVVNANTDRHVIEMVASYQAGGVYAPQFTVEGEVNSQKLVFAPRPDERRTDGTVWRVRRAVWSGPGLPSDALEKTHALSVYTIVSCRLFVDGKLFDEDDGSYSESSCAYPVRHNRPLGH